MDGQSTQGGNAPSQEEYNCSDESDVERIELSDSGSDRDEASEAAPSLNPERVQDTRYVSLFCLGHILCSEYGLHDCRSPTERHLEGLGLVKKAVPGDNHCLFHSFALLCPEKTMQQWRNVLADSLDARVLAMKQTGHYLFRARQSGRKHSTWRGLIRAMKGKEWGYADFITEFALYKQVALLCWNPDGSVAYFRDKSQSKVSSTFFLLNSANAKGKTILSSMCPTHVLWTCVGHISCDTCFGHDWAVFCSYQGTWFILTHSL